MASGVNKAIIIGNLGDDPESRVLPQGGTVVNFSVATRESWKDKNTGEMKERTEWHKIVIFNRLAEVAGQYLSKGSKVYLEGKLQTRKWKDQSGQDRYTTEIVANQMEMLDNKQEQSSQTQEFSNAQFSNPAKVHANGTQQVGGSVATQAPAGEVDEFDIPF